MIQLNQMAMPFRINGKRKVPMMNLSGYEAVTVYDKIYKVRSTQPELEGDYWLVLAYSQFYEQITILGFNDLYFQLRDVVNFCKKYVDMGTVMKRIGNQEDDAVFCGFIIAEGLSLHWENGDAYTAEIQELVKPLTDLFKFDNLKNEYVPVDKLKKVLYNPNFSYYDSTVNGNWKGDSPTIDIYNQAYCKLHHKNLSEANKYLFGTENPKDVKKLFESKSDDIREYGKIKKIISAKDKDANPILTEIGVLITKKYGCILEHITYSEKIGFEVDAIAFADDKASNKCYYLIIPTRESPEEREENRKHYHYGDMHFGWLRGK